VIQQFTGFPSSSKVREPLRLSSFKVERNIIDLIFRNVNDTSSIIHSAEFVVKKVKATPDPLHYKLFPSTQQYNVLVSPWDKEFSVNLSQEVPPQSADRFQIILALGRIKKSDEHKEGPWGYSLIFPPQFPHSNKKVAYADMTMILRLRYDEDQIIETSEFSTTLHPIGYGYKARKIAGFTLEEKIELLSDDDVNVVQSVIEVLTAIGDPKTLEVLRAFSKSNHKNLERYYEREIYGKTSNPGYYDLPDPEQRMTIFRRELKKAIEYLEEHKQTAS
jgi:hypothetical protein